MVLSKGERDEVAVFCFNAEESFFCQTYKGRYLCQQRRLFYNHIVVDLGLSCCVCGVNEVHDVRTIVWVF